MQEHKYVLISDQFIYVLFQTFLFASTGRFALSIPTKVHIVLRFSMI